MKKCKALSCNVHPRAEDQSILNMYCLLFMTPGTNTGSMQNRNCYCQAPSVCLPSVYLMLPHMTRSPRPSPSYCKQSNTRGGEGLGMRLWYWYIPSSMYNLIHTLMPHVSTDEGSNLCMPFFLSGQNKES